MTSSFVNDNAELMYRIHRELCHIPSPSNMEIKRAEYCRDAFASFGAAAFIDEANNVIFPYHCENSSRVTVFAAHTDTVFPDTEPMPYREADGRIYCPGVGDDTASVAVLMMCAKYVLEQGIIPDGGVMFVCNSGEEGLGNLYGTRHLITTYGDRIERFITFDAQLGSMHSRCVGSHRYEVTVRTEGGHSFNAFGKRNAIHALSEIISSIYRIKLPDKPDAKTTFNVGEISGGTSVNTVAQSAKALVEYRSDDVECLEYMRREFERIFDDYKDEETEVSSLLVGERPCAVNGDSEGQKALTKLCCKVIAEVMGCDAADTSASTDCNIPASVGIPSVCVGVYKGGGMHTREEYIEKQSLISGLELGIKVSVVQRV